MNKKILSIDGGGTRGIIPATIMDGVFKDTGKHPRELFDILIGTSTGGIISIAYAYGIPTKDLVDLFLTKSKEIFYEPWLDRLQPGDEYLVANYSNKNFKKILTDIFGNTKLGDLQADPNFGNHKDLIVTSFDLSPDDPTETIRNYKPVVIHSNFIRDKDFSLVDLALMTSAGPTYFPIYNQKYIDGAVALNNPSMAAIAYAINDSQDHEKKNYRYPDGIEKGLKLELKDLKMLSLSTGTSNMSRIETDTVGDGNWGNLKWLGYLPDLITETNMESTKYYVKQLLCRQDQYVRVEACFDQSNIDILKSSKKSINIDTTDDAILNAMHEYAKVIYEKNKDSILKMCTE